MKCLKEQVKINTHDNIFVKNTMKNSRVLRNH